MNLVSIVNYILIALLFRLEYILFFHQFCLYVRSFRMSLIRQHSVEVDLSDLQALYGFQTM